MGRTHIGDCELNGKRRIDGIERVPEGRIHSVTDHLDYYTAAVLNRLTRKRVVACECQGHPLRLNFPQSGATLDVGEQERHRAGRRRSVCAMRLVHGRGLP